MFFSIYDFNQFSKRTSTFDKDDKRLKNALRQQLGRSATKSELAEARRQLNLDIRLRNKNNVVSTYNQKIQQLDRQNRSNNKGVILNALGVTEYDEINGLSATRARQIKKSIDTLETEKTTRKLLKNINKQQKANRKLGLESFDELNANLSIDTVINMDLSLNGPSIENDGAAENIVDLRGASSLRDELKQGNVSPQRLEEIIKELAEIRFTTEAPDWVQDTLKAALGMRMGHDFETADLLYGHTKVDRDYEERKKNPPKRRKIELKF